MDNNKETKFDKWHQVYRVSNYAIGPAIFLIILILSAPWLYKTLFVDSKYCIGSKNLYTDILEEKVTNKEITSVFNRENKVSIYAKSSFTYQIITCSDKSKGSNPLLATEIKVGDTLYKESGSNEFTIIKEGREYIFDIDPDRDNTGELKE